MIRVLICDDQDVVREGLRAILGTAPTIEVVGIADDVPTAIEMVGSVQPDVVLMDLNMPGMSGIQGIRLLREQFPRVRVVALTTYDADEWVFDAIRAGAAGYLLKDTPRAGLVAAIEGTAAGQTHVDPAVAGKLFAHVGRHTETPRSTLAEALTEREQGILQLMSKGLANAEIARQIHLSEGTVRNYVSSILEKLGVSDRTQAVVLALRHGLVE